MSRQPDSHESYAVAAGVLHWAAAILALSLLAIVLLVYVWARPVLTAGAAPTRPIPPQPRLQPNPAADLAAERSLQRSRLDGYMWMDSAHTVARIPIERAMALTVASKGLSLSPALSPGGGRGRGSQGSRRRQAAGGFAAQVGCGAQAMNRRALSCFNPLPRALPGGEGCLRGRPLPVLLLLLGLLLWPWAAPATHAPPPPQDLTQRAGFDQRLGARIPLDARFLDANGQPVDLRALANGKPLLLALGYYRCPNLCDVVLNGMAHTLEGLDLQPGRDFEVAFVSIDPTEKPADARHAQAMLARMHPQARVARWHFLSGDHASIGALASAVGFRYFYDEKLHQYAHAAGLVAITPDGKVAQYFFGVSWPPASLRLALVHASQGELGNVIDRLVLLCCGYDPTTGRYSLAIGRTMQVMGVVFVLALAGWLAWLKARARA